MEHSLADDFKHWALDPARTNDELFTVELLIEWGRVAWGWKHQNPKPFDYPGKAAREEERKMNPAYRPELNPEWLDATVECWAELKMLYGQHYKDRPVRDLAALRFFPHLEKVTLDPGELVNMAPLAGLRGLQQLTFREENDHPRHLLEDLAGLRGLPQLAEVTLSLRTPWPDLSALADLPALRMLSVHANLQALREVPRLPRAEVVRLDADFHYRTPVRSMRDLPEMPEVRQLTIASIASLEGLERCPKVQNLDLEGPYRDLAPLAGLTELTFVKLTGEQFMDLAPLARAPRLRELVLVRERPLDVSVLAEAPELREVRVERCPVLATEVSALNAALLLWAGDFSATPPRPLGELRFYTYQPQHEEVKALQQIERAPAGKDRLDAYGGDAALAKAEDRWFVAKAQQRMDALLGEEWGVLDENWGPGRMHVTIRRYRDVMRFREVVQLLRELSAESRFAWNYMVSVEPHGDMSEDLRTIRKRQNPGGWLEEPIDPEEERENWESFRRERRKRREYLEREHRLNLQRQQGLEIDPEEFSPRAEPPAPPQKTTAGGNPAEDDEAEDDTGFDNGDDDAGGLAIPPPDDENQSDLARKLHFIVTLTEEILWVTSHMEENAAYIYGEEPVNWHELPEPPEERPFPG